MIKSLIKPLLFLTIILMFLTESYAREFIVEESFNKFILELKSAAEKKDYLFLRSVYSDWEKKGVKLTDDLIESLRSGLLENLLTKNPTSRCENENCWLMIKDKETTTSAKFVYRNNKWYFEPPSMN